MVVTQGDVFWADLGVSSGSEPAGKRPVLVVQSDLFNRTRINTAVVVALSTNRKLRSLPGNVPFRKGEANLPRTCVANVTQMATIDRKRLIERIGKISKDRLEEVLQGVALVLRGVE